MKKSDFIFFDLLGKIFQKQFNNNKLPSQRELSKIYNVSRFTIQKVFKKLENIGLIKTLLGNGAFIKESSLEKSLVYNSLTETSYDNIRSKVIYFKKSIADDSLSKIFNIAPGDDIWEFQRIRIVNYETVQLETSFLPYYLFQDFNKEIIESSIQKYVIKKKYKILYYITNYEATITNKEQSKLLNSKNKTPAMHITNRGVLKNGKIFTYSEIIALKYNCTYIVPFDSEVYNLRQSKQKK